MTFAGNPKPPTLLVFGAFAAIYLVWGSTYLVVRYAIETIPPFLMFGSRCVVAGIMLFLFARWKGASSPTASQWRAALLIGFLLIALASSLVAWAEKKVPSSVAALIVSGLPFWMVLFDRRNGRPTKMVLAGLVIGFTGVTVLVLNGKDYDNQPLEFLPVAACLFATLAWAIGSLLNRDVDTPDSPIMTVAAQMIAGGLLTMLIAFGIGEGAEFSFGEVTMRSFVAWCYLLVMGSILAYPAYIWLLSVVPPAKVSTYAFVNPPIAVALGCTVGGEPFSQQLLLASVLIIVAVVMIVVPRPKPASLADPVDDACDSPAET